MTTISNMDYLKEYVGDISVTYICKDGTKFVAISQSLDVNDHISVLSEVLSGLDLNKANGGAFEVFYLGKRMFIGDGPSYSSKSVKIMAKYDAEISQDIYCMCN